MELQSKLYDLLISCFTHSERRLEDLLDIVLQSGNMCHSLCSSPVDDVFIKMFLKHCPSSINEPFWKSCVTSKKDEIDQIFSVFPTLISTYSPNDGQAIKAQETNYGLKCAASNLITKVTKSDNPYADARIHYNLSERLLANGLHIEIASLREMISCLSLGALLVFSFSNEFYVEYQASKLMNVK
uniref:Uncharacterized protein n=1 Tax=Tanacetum cinerariifolium TaxID=118510 RepID=A0A6L2NY23_TANCI|nr:hypothetical protein [Tanacetum cinerariifolium]